MKKKLWFFLLIFIIFNPLYAAPILSSASVADYRMAIYVAIILLFIMAVIVYWNRKLQREIDVRLNVEKELREQHHLLKTFIETIPDAVCLKNGRGAWLLINTVGQELLNVEKLSWKGKTESELAVETNDFTTNHHSCQQRDELAWNSKKTIIENEYFVDTDGNHCIIEARRIPIFGEFGERKTLVIIGRDITKQKAAEDKQRLAASVFTHSQQGIVITDENNRIIDANPATEDLTGYSREEMLGNTPTLFSSGTQSPEFYADMWKKLNKDNYWQGEIWNRKKSGERYSERLTISAVRDVNKKLHHYVAVFSDITYLVNHEAELQQLAYKDALTNLPNRLLLRDRMQQSLAQSERYEKLVAVCYLDLDGFKPINDNYGHNAGDKVLIEVAQRLVKSVRTGDTVSRLGGDEFVILMLDLHSISELEQILNRILLETSKPIGIGDVAVTVSASIGIAMCPLDSSEADTLLRHADQAMYISKRQGKNCYSFFDPTEERRATRTQIIQNEIEIALVEDQFCLYYQPKVNMRTGEVVGLEALIRWLHPQRGLLLPASFLPDIEDNLLIVKLGNWVLEKALLQMRYWRVKGIKINVSVNIAALQLKQPDFVSSLRSLLNEYADVPTSNLELEILETTALHDIPQVHQIMEACAELGVSFALDDFGTGYSSLSYLKNLPAEVLKIDKSFVSNLLNNSDDISIIKGVLGMTNAFNRTPIAEGIETVQQGNLLLKLGCELGQGFGIARPMSAPEVMPWINNFQISPEWMLPEKTTQANRESSLLLMAVEHHRTLIQVIEAIEQRSPLLMPKRIEDHHACQLGQWLDTQGSEFYGKLPRYRQLVSSHRNLHKLCNQAIFLLENGNNNELDTIVTGLKKESSFILDNLNLFRNELAKPE